MEVTKNNFEEVLPLIEKSICNATFLSIDCEFTGLNSKDINITPYDTIETYYEKTRTNVTNFLTIQFGLSAFRYDAENDCFKQSSFNFFTFRRPINDKILDQKFLCQSSSIDFLISHNFDFNKLFKDGISYLNIDEENKLKNYLEKNQTDYKLDDFIGFSKVIKMMIEYRKVTIGHNILLDLLHMIDKFVAPLPTNYLEFKEQVQELFPYILDTKILSSSEIFGESINSTVLGQLYKRIQKNPFEKPKIEIEDDCEGYTSKDDKEHEAAYDSYITGVCFIALWNRLGKKKHIKSSKDIFKDHDLVAPYFNLVFLTKLHDNVYMNLKEKDPNPIRENIFHIKYPKLWNTDNVRDVFKDYEPITISRIDDTSAYVNVKEIDKVKLVYTKLCKINYKPYTVTPYQVYHENLKNENETIRRKSIESPSLSTNTKKRKKTIKEVNDLESKSSKKSTIFEQCDDWD